ncbi:hypothetical protein KM043_008619 [Ampulex compressa]|nr:hypothetical protein KM043_008619 [Ampulex compressa]
MYYSPNESISGAWFFLGEKPMENPGFPIGKKEAGVVGIPLKYLNGMRKDLGRTINYEESSSSRSPPFVVYHREYRRSLALRRPRVLPPNLSCGLCGMQVSSDVPLSVPWIVATLLYVNATQNSNALLRQRAAIRNNLLDVPSRLSALSPINLF